MNQQAGLQLYTLLEQLAQDFRGTLEQIAAIGYKEVELAPTYNKSARELRAAFNDAGLKCRSVHHFDFQQTPMQVMDFAGELGAAYFVTSFNPPPNVLAKLNSPRPDFEQVVKLIEQMTKDDYKRSAEICNELGEKAQQRGLTYAYHNHNLEFRNFGDTTAYDLLLQLTDPETVKMELDCGWTAAAGKDPVAYLKDNPKRYRLLHIKGFRAAPANLILTGPDKPAPTLLRNCKIDYAAIFAAAQTAEVEQYYVEQEPPFDELSPLQTIEDDYRFLQQLGIT